VASGDGSKLIASAGNFEKSLGQSLGGVAVVFNNCYSNHDLDFYRFLLGMFPVLWRNWKRRLQELIVHPFACAPRARHSTELERNTMKNFAAKIRSFLKSEDGPTAVEYAVMLALIVVVCLGAIRTIGTNASTTFNKVSQQLK
jgi:pilus assembly protein Flp/PilA